MAKSEKTRKVFEAPKPMSELEVYIAFTYTCERLRNIYDRAETKRTKAAARAANLMMERLTTVLYYMTHPEAKRLEEMRDLTDDPRIGLDDGPFVDLDDEPM